MSFRVTVGDTASVGEIVKSIITENPVLYDVFVVHSGDSGVESIAQTQRTDITNSDNIEENAKEIKSSFALVSRGNESLVVYDSRNKQLTQICPQLTQQEVKQLERLGHPFKRLKTEYRDTVHNLSRSHEKVVLLLQGQALGEGILSHFLRSDATISIYHDQQALSTVTATCNQHQSVCGDLRCDVASLDPLQIPELYEYLCLVCMGSEQIRPVNCVDGFFSQYSAPEFVVLQNNQCNVTRLEYLLSDGLAGLMEHDCKAVHFRVEGFHKRWLLFRAADNKWVLWQSSGETEGR